ncbi:uncharacterized protein RSE6_10687 [Rhynchosporium secalis]|uniref:Uncharacterized protein n=1 Tax=Rhynchosporium secalis TaxID=38038 RepID=A0A1E1ML44_RHYSE|nr:uncharacterized protein RSE6_10687 [Rhynchosporium secalis]
MPPIPSCHQGTQDRYKDASISAGHFYVPVCNPTTVAGSYKMISEVFQEICHLLSIIERYCKKR